jgi:signal transduction histidine kinase
MLGYILLQGISFNAHSVNGYGEMALDMFISLIPAFLIFYVFAVTELTDQLLVFAYMYALTVVIDVFIFSWASLKLLLFTDKNAQSAG